MVNWFSKFIHKKKTESPPKEPETAKAEMKQATCGMTEFKKQFDNDDTFVTREFLCSGKQCCIAFIDGMVDTALVNRHIVEPLMNAELPEGTDAIQYLLDSVISSDETHRQKDLAEMANDVLRGDTIVFLEGTEGALTFNSKKWNVRAITEPESEKVTKGPREGFNESLIVNLALIRRKITTPDLKFKFRTVGQRSNTKACIIYLQGLADQKVLEELNRRLDTIDIDAVLSVNYLDELIRDCPYSLFNTTSTTERPDVVAAKLLEGRVAVMVEGCPCGLTVPFIFLEYFQAAEDYYGNYWMASIARIMRILGFVLTLTIPAIYLALVTMHQEMVPSSLLLAINAARQDVPLPSIMELIIMLIVLEIMRESGARVPAFLGQSLSIVGGLVIGQAAVAARLISAPIVIVVAFTAITSLLMPKIEGASFIYRLAFILLTSVLGFYGLMIGLTAMFIHLLGIRSFGVPFMYGVLPPTLQEFKDSAIRAPWWYMIMRPRHISAKDSVRQSGKKL